LDLIPVPDWHESFKKYPIPVPARCEKVDTSPTLERIRVEPFLLHKKKEDNFLLLLEKSNLTICTRPMPNCADKFVRHQ